MIIGSMVGAGVAVGVGVAVGGGVVVGSGVAVGDGEGVDVGVTVDLSHGGVVVTFSSTSALGACLTQPTVTTNKPIMNRARSFMSITK